MLLPGSRVAVRGLTASPEYNGARGDVLFHDKARDRFAVRLLLFDRKELLLREESLELIYKLQPEALEKSRSAIAEARLDFEKCGEQWGGTRDLGRALVARRVICKGETVFREAPFLVVSNPDMPDSCEKWLRRWDVFFEMTRQSTASKECRALLEAFQASDTGGEDVVESLMPRAEQVLERMWLASGCSVEQQAAARASPMFLREVRRVAAVLARWQTNQHELGGPQLRALYWAAPKVAHSCTPNVGWEDPDLATGEVELRALRDIAPGEVLGVNYMPDGFLALPLKQRREQLSQERKFVCACPRCRQEELYTSSVRTATSAPMGPCDSSSPLAPPRVVVPTVMEPAVPSSAVRPVPMAPAPAAGSLDAMD